MRDLKFRMLTQTTDKILGYVDIYDLLRDGSEVLPDFEEAVFEGVKFEQYTGLKDKNGKEIYEGDIVKTTDRVTFEGLIFPVGVVEFKQRAFWICNVPSERPELTHNETLLQYWETDLEVIGNIHKNPELLKGAKNGKRTESDTK